MWPRRVLQTTAMASQRNQKTRPTVLTSVRTISSRFDRVTTVLPPWHRVYIPSARGRCTTERGARTPGTGDPRPPVIAKRRRRVREKEESGDLR